MIFITLALTNHREGYTIRDVERYCTLMIGWKLDELMARHKAKNKDLAKFLGITKDSASKLRKPSVMPRLTGDRLDGICQFLQCQPGELLEWIAEKKR